MTDSVIILALLGLLTVTLLTMPVLDWWAHRRAKRRAPALRTLHAPDGPSSVNFLRQKSGPANRSGRKGGAVTYETYLGLIHFRGTRQQGDFGEMLTAVMVTAQGYAQLPSQYNRNNGLDGVFVRRDKPGAFSHVLITETKTGQPKINSDIMTDAGVRRRLDRMYAEGLLTYETAALLIKMLDSGSKNFKKQLWQHRIGTGETLVYDLDANQKFVGKPQELTNKGLFEALVRNMVTVGKLTADLRSPPR